MLLLACPMSTEVDNTGDSLLILELLGHAVDVGLESLMLRHGGGEDGASGNVSLRVGSLDNGLLGNGLVDLFLEHTLGRSGGDLGMNVETLLGVDVFLGFLILSPGLLLSGGNTAEVSSDRDGGGSDDGGGDKGELHF